MRLRNLASVAAIFGAIMGATYWSVQVSGQAPGAAPGTAEIRDAGGQVILTGRFQVDTDDDDDEWRARLEATGADPDAAGTVEVERARNGSDRDIEFSLVNVQGDAPYTLVIDGQELITVRVGTNGRVSVDLDASDDD